MTNIIEMSFSAPRPTNMSPLQRSVYFAIGLGVIISSLVLEPMSALWFAAINIAGIALVTSAIIGRGVRLSRLVLKDRKNGSIVQPLTSMSLAVGISVVAMTTALTPAWMAIAQMVSITLMLSAILSMEFVMTEKRHANIKSITQAEEDEQVFPQAA